MMQQAVFIHPEVQKSTSLLTTGCLSQAGFTCSYSFDPTYSEEKVQKVLEPEKKAFID